MNVFVAHYLCVQVKAVVLDPRNHFNVDRTLTKQDVQQLIEVKRKLFRVKQEANQIFESIEPIASQNDSLFRSVRNVTH